MNDREPVDSLSNRHARMFLWTTDVVDSILRGLPPQHGVTSDEEVLWVEFEDLVRVGAPMRVVDQSLVTEMTALQAVMLLELADKKDDGTPSQNSAMRIFKQNGYRINNKATNDPDRTFTDDDIVRYQGTWGFDLIMVSRGKADVHALVIPWEG